MSFNSQTDGHSQTDYSFNPVVGTLGQRYREHNSDEVVTYPAAAQITPGSLLELITVAGVDKVRLAQSASGALKPLVGVALFEDRYAPALGATNNYFQAGDLVPVLRKGRVFAAWNGTTQASLATVNYEHSSTTNPQGSFTDAATATTAGSEIDLANGVRLVKNLASSTMCLVELNLPQVL